MKSIRIPCVILALLLVLSLVNSAAIGHHCTRWIDLAEAADHAAEQAEWGQANVLLEQLGSELEGCSFWLRVVLSHTGPDQAASLADEASLYGRLRDEPDMRRALGELRRILEEIARSEQLSLENIL